MKTAREGAEESSWSSSFSASSAGDKLIDELRRAQESFMDLPNCTFFFASEEA